MDGLADSTTVTYNKLPHYLQPYPGSPNNTITAYSHVGYAPVGYTTATVPVPQLRSTHQKQSPAADEPHLGDCIITPSPTGSTLSQSPDENGSTKETLFRPISFERLASGVQGSHRTSSVALHVVPPTPSDSAESSDRESPNEDSLPEVLLVRIPRKAPATGIIEPVEDNCTNGRTISSSPPPASASLTPANEITVNLLDEELWQTFKSIGNEMIVTKPGRRLFPALLVNIRGLDHHTEYSISLRISSADPYRYKFLNMQWVAVGESEVMQNEDRQIFCHPNSPNTGLFWMKKPISFKQVKITHNHCSKHGNVLLHTMHKYVMEIVLEPAGQPTITIPIPDTEFMAVTAYQNNKITQLKIENNPFAKGFRDRENAGFHHPSTMFSSALPLPSLYGSSGQTPLWHQMPQLACRIPPIPVSGPGNDMLHTRSSSPEEGYPKQPDVLPTLPTYPRPVLPPPYPYFPTTSWPTVYPPPGPNDYCSES